MTSNQTTPSMNYSQKFLKSQRLLKPAEFKKVFDGCDKKIHQSHIMAFILINDIKQARIGMAITKKKVPTAVARNKVKRYIRECFRQQAIHLSAVDIVFIIKKPINDLTNEQLKIQIQTILTKIKHQFATNAYKK